MNENEKLIKILEYVKKETEYMWAASIVSIICDIDFRDASENVVNNKIKELKEK